VIIHHLPKLLWLRKHQIMQIIYAAHTKQHCRVKICCKKTTVIIFVSWMQASWSFHELIKVASTPEKTIKIKAALICTESSCGYVFIFVNSCCRFSKVVISFSLGFLFINSWSPDVDTYSFTLIHVVNSRRHTFVFGVCKSTTERFCAAVLGIRKFGRVCFQTFSEMNMYFF